MAETSRPQITITFGRTGQVVKRAEAAAASGSKRSVRDRSGTAVDSLKLHNKRLRPDNGRWSLTANNSVDDFHLSKDDLRFKIMKQTQTTVDLRDMLSQRARSSTAKPVTPHSLHEPRHGRQITPEMREERRRIPEPRDPRNIPDPRDPRNIHELRDPRQTREPRDDRHRMPEFRDDTQMMAEPIEVRHHIPKLNDTRQHILEPTNGSMTRHLTSMRTSEDLSQMDFLRNFYSPRTLDHIRCKSPVLNTSRGLSPPRRTEETQRRPVIREYEAPKSVTYGSRDVCEISRPMTTTSFMTKPSLSVGPTESVRPLATAPLPSGSNIQRSQYPVAEHLAVEGFLRSLRLEKYLISFKVEEVDMVALGQMEDHDLKEMGIPMGPRKKILLALRAHARGQAQ